MRRARTGGDQQRNTGSEPGEGVPERKGGVNPTAEGRQDAPGQNGFHDEVKTYNDIYLDIRRELKAAGVEDYNLEARLLIGAASGKSREELQRDMHLYAASEVERRVEEMCARRLSGEPVAYVLGEWEFMGLPFKVDRQVLIPRPDTEVLAQRAIQYLRAEKGEGARVLDLCCGTGCVGISIAKYVATCRHVVLVDNSVHAIMVTRANILKNGVTRIAPCIAADATKAPPVSLDKFDLIVCNPPYVPTAEIDSLDRGVRDFEPREALDGGEDGLDFYRAIIRFWAPTVKEDGEIMFECGEGQAELIGDMLRGAGFNKVTYHPDPAGTKRVVEAAR